MYAEQRLEVTRPGFGALLAAIGVGAAIGPLVLLRVVRRPRRPLFVFGPFLLRGVVDLVLAATTRLPIAAVGLVAYGMSTSTGAVTSNSMLQAETSDRVRGRVFALMDVLWQAGRLVSLTIGAALADLVDIRAVYVLGGVLLLIAGSPGLRTTRGR